MIQSTESRTAVEDSPANQEKAASTCPHCGASFPAHLMVKARYALELECEKCRAVLKPVRSNTALKRLSIPLIGFGFAALIFIPIIYADRNFLQENLCLLTLAIPFVMVFFILALIPMSRSLSKWQTTPPVGFAVIKRPPPRNETPEQKAGREKREERKRYLDSLVDKE